MILDSDRQRTILLQMIEDMNIPGKHLDEIVALRQAIRDAAVGQPAPPIAGTPA